MSMNSKQLNEIKAHLQTSLELKQRRGVYLEIDQVMSSFKDDKGHSVIPHLEKLDLIYRTLCGILYNFVPTSGHPGGSISCGRFVEALLYQTMSYDLKSPNRRDNDLLSYGAGHKAMGLYAMWAIRNEIARAGDPTLLPTAIPQQMRLEDLLGFRKNPTTPTTHYLREKSKALDGHAGPNVPFVPISTGPSGVATAATCGIALAALDYYPEQAPWIHVIEGETGMTAGRVLEVLSMAATARLKNLVLHLDWNQASIDSNRPCRENGQPGDYVQWTPAELAYLNDWNVIVVDDGFDFAKILAAQSMLGQLHNPQPTCIVYRTVKGWRYGIEGKDSHGAGHKCCSPEYYNYLATFEKEFGVQFPRLTAAQPNDQELEDNFWASLLLIRKVIAHNQPMTQALAAQLRQRQTQLTQCKRTARAQTPHLESIYQSELLNPNQTPEALQVKAGSKTTLRGVLGQALNHLNHQSGGAFLGAAADLYGSTSLNVINKGFPEGFYDSVNNPLSRMISLGGICEDAMGAVMTGVATYGTHIGVAASYAAFIAAFEHVATRVHCIGQQLKQELEPAPYCSFIMINGHAGIKTGEDGPTHADPQPLQLLQENFVKGTAITLTPWEPSEIWPLLAAALKARPALIAPFVTRPNETVPDRQALGLAPAAQAQYGVYPLLSATSDLPRHGTLVIQGSESAYAFVSECLPKLRAAKLNLQVYYVASAELFDLLPLSQQEAIFPAEHAHEAMGISGFTLPTLYRWVTSNLGRQHSLYPFKAGHYLGSGRAEMVVSQAGLDGESQYKAIKEYVEALSKSRKQKGRSPVAAALL